MGKNLTKIKHHMGKIKHHMGKKNLVAPLNTTFSASVTCKVYSI